MSLEPLVVVQTQPDMPPGLLSTWARARGLALDVRRVDLGDPLPEPHNGAAILGSDTSVNDRSTPWLADLQEWAADAVAADIPTLGIAFGAQIIAQQLGADVRPAPAPEAGWVAIDSAEPWLPAGPWLAWNHELIVPTDTLHVTARNAHGVQAFTDGPDGRHIGVQFRPEATTATIDAWAIRAGLTTLVDRAPLHAQTARHCADATARARILFDHWAVAAGLLQTERVAVAA
jgi:GMP synthase (glutamine-hydrolysing)